MSQICNVCSTSVSHRIPGLQCVFCENFFHIKCVNINKNQYDTLTSIDGCVWKCTGCTKKTVNTELIMKAIENLQNTVSTLQKQLQEVKSETTLKSSSNCSPEVIINEIIERQNREKNIIIFKLPTSNTPNADLQKANDILKSIIPDGLPQITDVTRLGRGQGNNPAPLKVSLQSREEVINILKNKRKLKDTGRYKDIVISTDQTKMQQQYYKEIKCELIDRKQNGEQNIYIKYANGIPTIAKAKN